MPSRPTDGWPLVQPHVIMCLYEQNTNFHTHYSLYAAELCEKHQNKSCSPKFPFTKKRSYNDMHCFFLRSRQQTIKSEFGISGLGICHISNVGKC